MDSFAAALTQGAAARVAATPSGALRIGAAFGSAQAIMPLLGWALGLAFASIIRDVDHWVAFGLLTVIGGHMIREGVVGDRDNAGAPVPLIIGWALVGAAVATSVDAAAAGVTLVFLDQPVLAACVVIGAVTFVLLTAGVLLGGALGAVVGKQAELLGGLVLIGLGTKIPIEHLFFGG